MKIPARGSVRSAAAPDDVLVVGGGVIGLSIAESLATEGLRVRLLESETVGAGASGAAAGMLAPLSEARADGPLLRFGLEGLRQLGPLCDRLRADTGIDPELEASGLIQVAKRPSEAADLKARMAWLNDRAATAEPFPAVLGSPAQSGNASRAHPQSASLEWIDREDLLKESEAYSPSVLGGLLSSFECHLRPPLLLRALEKSACAKGVEIESGLRGLTLCRGGGRIVGVQSSAGRHLAEHIVVAAGPWTAGLLEASGIVLGAQGLQAESESGLSAGSGESHSRRLPIEPVRGQILSLEGPLPNVREVVWGEGIYLVPKRDGTWIVGATEERVGFDRRVTASGVAWLLERARAVFPALENASFGTAWAGLRPVSDDGLPRIGGARGCPGLFVAAGHGRNGILHSAVTAERVRDEILGKHDPDLLDPFRVDRPAAS